MTDFEQEVVERLAANGENAVLQEAAHHFTRESTLPKYSYNFFWQGRPIIQYPQDMVAMQELIWQIKPDLIIETGIAHGGSLIFSASMLTLLDDCDAAEQGKTLDPKTAVHQYLKTHPEFEIDKHIVPISTRFLSRVESFSTQAADTIGACSCQRARGTTNRASGWGVSIIVKSCPVTEP